MIDKTTKQIVPPLLKRVFCCQKKVTLTPTAVGNFFSEVIEMSNERVFESTRIISEDEVPPEILEEIRRKEASHADTVTKIVNTTDSKNVGALMSAARPNVIEKPPEAELTQRGSALASKLVNIGKIGDEEFKRQRAERIRTKAKSIADIVNRGLKRDADENSQVENVSV